VSILSKSSGLLLGGVAIWSDSWVKRESWSMIWMRKKITGTLWSDFRASRLFMQATASSRMVLPEIPATISIEIDQKMHGVASFDKRSSLNRFHASAQSLLHSSLCPF
jgi:hypothetical protein